MVLLCGGGTARLGARNPGPDTPTGERPRACGKGCRPPQHHLGRIQRGAQEVRSGPPSPPAGVDGGPPGGVQGCGPGRGGAGCECLRPRTNPIRWLRRHRLRQQVRRRGGLLDCLPPRAGQVRHGQPGHVRPGEPGHPVRGGPPGHPRVQALVQGLQGGGRRGEAPGGLSRDAGEVYGVRPQP